MFSSLCPTYLFKISGPLTTFGSFPFSIFPICRAISVLPVPAKVLPLVRARAGGQKAVIHLTSRRSGRDAVRGGGGGGGIENSAPHERGGGDDEDCRRGCRKGFGVRG